MPHRLVPVRRAVRWLGVRLLGLTVWLQPKTEAKADHRTVQMLKPKPKPKTEKTKILIRFGAVWFGFRLLMYLCPG